MLIKKVETWNCNFGGQGGGFMVGYSSAAAAVCRRQSFVLRGLGGYSCGQNSHNLYRSSFQLRMQSAVSGGKSMEADSTRILRSITPTLDPSRHKGQAGKSTLLVLIHVFGN